MNIITVNHYYAGTGNIPPSFQSLDVVMADEAIALEKELEDERKENKMFIELNAKLTEEAQQLREINTRFLSAIIDVSCPLCGLKKY